MKKIGAWAIGTTFILTGCHKTIQEPVQIEAREDAAIEASPLCNVSFSPPANWRMVDSSELSPSVKLMVVGAGSETFPPSINLTVEAYPGTLKEYLQCVAAINQSKGYDWKDLGIIRTAAGNASYSQVDRTSEWGDIRMMHVILQNDGMIYIMTAAALKNEFAVQYRSFFNAFKSLEIKPCASEEIGS